MYLKSFMAAMTVAVVLGVCGGVASADRIERVAGGGTMTEGPAIACKLDRPFASGKDRNGTLYIAEESGRMVAVDRNGRMRRIAGGKAGRAAASTIIDPHGEHRCRGEVVPRDGLRADR